MIRMGTRALVALCFGVFLFWGNCACEKQNVQVQTEDDLDRMAQEYWTKRLVEKDYRFTYNLEDVKDTMSFEDYVEKVKPLKDFGVASVRTKKIEKGEDGNALVWMGLTSSNPAVPRAYEMSLPDTWILKEGQWRHQLTRKKEKK